MATTLTEYLEGKTCEGLQARPLYFRAGDHLTFFFDDGRAVEERVDELLTVYRSQESGEMVGCKIKGVKRLMAELGNFGVFVDDGKISLGLLFLTAVKLTGNNEDIYKDLASKAKNTAVDRRELMQAA